MKPEELARLRAIAEAATPGEWRALYYCGGSYRVVHGDQDRDINDEFRESFSAEDAAHIAAFSPAPAKRLLDHIARLEDALREAREAMQNAVLGISQGQPSQVRYDLEEALAKIDAALGEGV